MLPKSFPFTPTCNLLGNMFHGARMWVWSYAIVFKWFLQMRRCSVGNLHFFFHTQREKLSNMELNSRFSLPGSYRLTIRHEPGKENHEFNPRLVNFFPCVWMLDIFSNFLIAPVCKLHCYIAFLSWGQRDIDLSSGLADITFLSLPTYSLSVALLVR